MHKILVYLHILINVLYVNKQEFCASSWRSTKVLCRMLGCWVSSGTCDELVTRSYAQFGLQYQRKRTIGNVFTVTVTYKIYMYQSRLLLLTFGAEFVNRSW